MKEFWNYVDLGANYLTLTYIAMYVLDSNNDAKLLILALSSFFSWLRSVAYVLRMMKKTRTLVVMI